MPARVFFFFFFFFSPQLAFATLAAVTPCLSLALRRSPLLPIFHIRLQRFCLYAASLPHDTITLRAYDCRGAGTIALRDVFESVLPVLAYEAPAQQPVLYATSPSTRLSHDATHHTPMLCAAAAFDSDACRRRRLTMSPTCFSAAHATQHCRVCLLTMSSPPIRRCRRSIDDIAERGAVVRCVAQVWR